MKAWLVGLLLDAARKAGRQGLGPAVGAAIGVLVAGGLLTATEGQLFASCWNNAIQPLPSSGVPMGN